MREPRPSDILSALILSGLASLTSFTLAGLRSLYYLFVLLITVCFFSLAYRATGILGGCLIAVSLLYCLITNRVLHYLLSLGVLVSYTVLWKYNPIIADAFCVIIFFSVFLCICLKIKQYAAQ
jgi:hypothetical protein